MCNLVQFALQTETSIKPTPAPQHLALPVLVDFHLTKIQPVDLVLTAPRAALSGGRQGERRLVPCGDVGGAGRRDRDRAAEGL